MNAITQQQERAVHDIASELAIHHHRSVVTPHPDNNGNLTVAGLDKHNNIRELAFVATDGTISRHDT
jgi:hypothetical protein